ncbi:MAG: adenylate/guanylate cyclase domain-containing protein [Halofilum sp. (in: g-proteobacteria)]
MTTSAAEVSVLFADIGDSTALYEALGDSEAHRVVTRVLETLAGVAERHGGTVVKEIGDEIMVTLDTVEAAAAAACDMHEALEDRNEHDPAKTRVSVRIGLFHGPVITDTEDIYGDTVNIAARMVEQAKARQIVLPRATARTLPDEFRRSTRFIDYATIRGKGEVELVELLWEHDDLTLMAGTDRPVDAPAWTAGRLRVRYGECEVILDASRTVLVLGRNRVCNLRIDEPLASRQHIRIERRNDRFFLVDQSTNGTWLRQTDGSEHFIRRSEFPLVDAGRISLGRPLDDDKAKTVEFMVEPV